MLSQGGVVGSESSTLYVVSILSQSMLFSPHSEQVSDYQPANCVNFLVVCRGVWEVSYRIYQRLIPFSLDCVWLKATRTSFIRWVQLILMQLLCLWCTRKQDPGYFQRGCWAATTKPKLHFLICRKSVGQLMSQPGVGQ